jgi:hypothetical protein
VNGPGVASLVQDVWLGWEPRLRGRRLVARLLEGLAPPWPAAVAAWAEAAGTTAREGSE